eukprot:superscaffoldBa00001076_g8831
MRRQGNFNAYSVPPSQGYDDGYGGEYDDESYEAYEDNYSNPSKSISEYYEYGHGTSDESYNNYEQKAHESAPRGLKTVRHLQLRRQSGEQLGCYEDQQTKH